MSGPARRKLPFLRDDTILQVRDLRVYYHTPLGAVRAVDGVSFDLRVGERLGLVGESGSGKSTVAMAIMRLIKPPGRIEGGQALFGGVDLLALPEKEMRALRLAAIALVAQGAMNSLNPVTRVLDQFADALRDHGEILTRVELEARSPRAAIERVTLRAEPALVRAAQLGLFAPPGPAPERLATTLARLAALCGADRVGAPTVVDTHRPGAAAVMPFTLAPAEATAPCVPGWLVVRALRPPRRSSPSYSNRKAALWARPFVCSVAISEARLEIAYPAARRLSAEDLPERRSATIS